MTDQEIMDKVKAIRDKTGKTTWFHIDGDAFSSGNNSLEYHFNHDFNTVTDVFKTREAFVAHLDGILDNLRPKD